MAYVAAARRVPCWQAMKVTKWMSDEQAWRGHLDTCMVWCMLMAMASVHDVQLEQFLLRAWIAFGMTRTFS